MSKKLINICQKTTNHFKNLLINSNKKNIFIGIEGGGCSGFKYNIKTTNNKAKKYDEYININGVPIIICGKSLIHILGTNIIWKDNIMGSYIHFENPNVINSCGCNESFNLK